MNKKILKTMNNKKILISTFIPFLLLSSFPINEPCVDTYQQISLEKSSIDIAYIKNITENLSEIITNIYSENEIAKGRDFGTKGEQAAFEYLYKEMKNLNICTCYQPLSKRYKNDFINSKINVTEYKVTIRNNAGEINISCLPIITYPNQANYFCIKCKANKDLLSKTYYNLPIVNKETKALISNQKYVLLEYKGVDNFTYHGETVLHYLLKNLGMNKSNIEKIIPNSEICIEKKDPNLACKLIYYPDDNKDDDVYNQNYVTRLTEPRFFINETTGNLINQSINNASIDPFTVNFTLQQEFIDNVNSSNIIGFIHGKDTSRTAIICCLYDSAWCQGTGDSAIGMGIVLAIAKFFINHHITPKYNLKFIGFCGEEHGRKGSKYYASTHRFEKIAYVIDLNQLALNQTNPPLRLEICSNNPFIFEKIWKYTDPTYNAQPTPVFSPVGHISDDRSFSLQRPYNPPFINTTTICFLENGQWLYHHRDSKNHDKGDTMYQFNESQVTQLANMILNITRSLVDDTFQNTIRTK